MASFAARSAHSSCIPRIGRAPNPSSAFVSIGSYVLIDCTIWQASAPPAASAKQATPHAHPRTHVHIQWFDRLQPQRRDIPDARMCVLRRRPGPYSSIHPTRQNPPKPSRNCAKLNPRFPGSPAKHWTPAYFGPPEKISRTSLRPPPRLAHPTAEQNRTSPNTVPLRTHRESPALTQNHTHKTHT